MPLRILAALLAVCALAAPADTNADYKISGWRESVFGVSDLDAHIDYLTLVGSWEEAHRSSLSEQQLAHWGLPSSASGVQVLMRNPGSTTGYIRLVEFAGVAQRQARSNTQAWDTGGIYDINVRVINLQEKFARLQAMGWQAANDPTEFTFGPFRVGEWIARGPDGVAFAFIERLAPPLEGWPHLKHFSRAFNSTQTVRDMEASLRFYKNILGFRTYLTHKGASDAPGDNVLGLPHNIAMQHERRVEILHPDGINEGSVELLAFEGIRGRDVAEHAVPPNLGILMLRFPVRNLAALVAHLRASGVELQSKLQRFEVPPYGEVDIVAVRAPEGTWLEFYEAQQP